jgi:TnpA family transposase
VAAGAKVGSPPDEKHTTDTDGHTDLVFAVFDLVGLMFSPRIRGLAEERLWSLDGIAVPALVDSLVRQRVKTERISEHWDDLLRIGTSIAEGHVTSSLLVSKRHAHSRKNQLVMALRKCGRHDLFFEGQARQHLPSYGRLWVRRL